MADPKTFREALEARCDIWFRGCEPEKHPEPDPSEVHNFMAGARAALELLADEHEAFLATPFQDPEPIHHMHAAGIRFAAKAAAKEYRARAREVSDG